MKATVFDLQTANIITRVLAEKFNCNLSVDIKVDTPISEVIAICCAALNMRPEQLPVGRAGVTEQSQLCKIIIVYLCMDYCSHSAPAIMKKTGWRYNTILYYYHNAKTFIRNKNAFFHDGLNTCLNKLLYEA
ncbi:MAG: hypothetical protein QM768_21645 [Agriterribacter sp.]